MSEPSPDRRRRAAEHRSSDAAIIRFVDVDGVRLRTSIRGTGAPLLIITGLGASLELAEPFEREIVARGAQVISFDAPGVGESTGYPWPKRMPGVARTVERMLDDLGYQQVDVIGVSLGGVIAQQFAHQAPDRVRRLVLAATGPGVVGLGGIPGSPQGDAGPGHPPALPVAGLLPPGRRRPVRRDGPHRPDALLHGSIARFSQTPSLGGYLGQLYAISFWTGIPWLWRLRQPTLVLTGDDDPIIPVLNGRILAHCIPDAELRVIQGGGHLFLLERPVESRRPGREFPATAHADTAS